MLDIFILGSYFGILIILCIFGWHRLHITRLYKNNAHKNWLPAGKFEELPMVTLQLPVFNEKFVVERLIDATLLIDYPKDKLQIQVLDDSTDETVQLAATRVAYYQEKGFDIEHIHRVDRTGFKAGALANGMTQVKGEFIAIFDADFIPNPAFLNRCIHFFTNPKMGMVQTRWDHLNRSDSLLTQVQAMMLDAHFMIEHNGRSASGLFFNFNGTAGIWRREAIDDAGGWQHDTLTEDLDLSYRAQMKGWQFQFLPDLACPAELPVNMTAFKSQQHRWAKGSIQVMLKILPKLMRSDLPFRIKSEAFFHLTGNVAYLLMIINCIFFLIPSMVIRGHQHWKLILFVDGPLFFMLSASFIYFYLSSQKAVFGNIKGRKRYVPALMSVGIGLAVNNTRAVIEAFIGMESPFVRTPKAGDSKANQRKKGSYRLPKAGWGFVEMGLGLLYATAVVWAIASEIWASIPFLLLFQNGFLYIGTFTLIEEWQHRNKRPKVSDSKLSSAA